MHYYPSCIPRTFDRFANNWISFKVVWRTQMEMAVVTEVLNECRDHSGICGDGEGYQARIDGSSSKVKRMNECLFMAFPLPWDRFFWIWCPDCFQVSQANDLDDEPEADSDMMTGTEVTELAEADAHFFVLPVSLLFFLLSIEKCHFLAECPNNDGGLHINKISTFFPPSAQPFFPFKSIAIKNRAGGTNKK
jgi:hypothetical protein